MICSISGAASRQFTATLTAPSLARPNVDLEELGAVLLDERDPVAEADAGRAERLGGVAGPRVELGEGDRPVADHEGGGVGPLRGVHADDVGDGGDLVTHGTSHTVQPGWKPCRFMSR